MINKIKKNIEILKNKAVSFYLIKGFCSYDNIEEFEKIAKNKYYYYKNKNVFYLTIYKNTYKLECEYKYSYFKCLKDIIEMEDYLTDEYRIEKDAYEYQKYIDDLRDEYYKSVL